MTLKATWGNEANETLKEKAAIILIESVSDKEVLSIKFYMADGTMQDYTVKDAVKSVIQQGATGILIETV